MWGRRKGVEKKEGDKEKVKEKEMKSKSKYRVFFV